MNPAREVQTERFSRLNGKTPAFHEGEVATLLAAIDSSTPVGLRDRALLATLAYTFARISAVIGLTVADYFPSGKRWMIRFREKGGKEKELPVHHQLEQVLDDYLLKTKLSEEPEAPLFPAARAGLLSRRPINRVDAAEMIKRPLRQAGLPEHYSAHSYKFLTQARLALVVPLSRFRHIRLCRQADLQAVTHLTCSPAKTRALASSQEEPASGFWSYSSRRASIIAFSCSLSSPLSNHASLSSSFSFARISRRSSALSLGSASRISALIMAEIYRGNQGPASMRLGKKWCALPCSALPFQPVTHRCQ
jgi:hypothetical protein